VATISRLAPPLPPTLPAEIPAFDPALPHAVILNPSANGGRGRQKFAQAAAGLGPLGLDRLPVFDGSVADEPGARAAALVAWIAWQVRHGRRNFVAAGGDGTVNLALNGLQRARQQLGLPRHALRLGAIGIGSSNDFLKPVAAPHRGRVAGLAYRLDFARAFAHDLGVLELDAITGDTTTPVERYFGVNASVGVSAEGCWIYNRNGWLMRWLKQRWIDAAVVLAGLHTCLSYRNVHAELTVDGEAETVDITNLGVVKNVHFTGSLRYDVARAPDDGVFGVHLAHGMNKLEMLRTMHTLGGGSFSKLPKTRSRTARVVSIRAARPFTMEADGEIARTRRATLRVLRAELMICP
jgi:diacylglycerol kinase (ATP)